MRSDWENPRITRTAAARPAPEPPHAPASGRRAAPELVRPDGDGDDGGTVHPFAFLRFIGRNVVKIAMIAALLLAAFLGAFSLLAFPYRATALVLVDPRQQYVTPTQDVLPAIGTDAATLESVVQIVQASGFLSRLLEDLDVSADPELADVPDADPREKLAAFRKNLTVERRGATYLVDITYSSRDPERAAAYANAVAQAFVDGQNKARTDAAENAAGSLSARLGELRGKLRATEAAAAAFKIGSGIIDAGADSTLAQREISELSEQIALARTRTEQAKARYEHLESASAAGDGGGASPSAELTLLRRQQADLNRAKAQLSRTYGSRHPRIADVESQLEALEGQIRKEETRVAGGLKQQYDVARQQQQAFEDDLARLSLAAGRTDEAKVQLADLERQAAADRAIYEQYLARFKATDEQKMLEVDDVRIVSPAIPPLRSTRPSMLLIAAVLGLFSLGAAVTGLFLREGLASGSPFVPRSRG